MATISDRGYCCLTLQLTSLDLGDGVPFFPIWEQSHVITVGIVFLKCRVTHREVRSPRALGSLASYLGPSGSPLGSGLGKL